MTKVPIILVTQRVVVDVNAGERRDALDQNWSALLSAAGFMGIPVPNDKGLIATFLRELKPSGILLTGGNDLSAYGGDAPERDAVELELLRIAIQENMPLLGVCRGMQIIQHYFGVKLRKVQGHVQKQQVIDYCGSRISVNSYHNFGSAETVEKLTVCGRSDDQIVKAVAVKDAPVCGIMWHPERLAPFRQEDVALLRDMFTPPSFPSAVASLPNALQALA